MPFDGVSLPFARTAPVQPGAAVPVAQFTWAARLACVLGACAAGALGGAALAFSLGALPIWALVVLVSPSLLLALYLAGRTGLEAGATRDGYAVMLAALQLAVLAAWPASFALISWAAPELWLLPLAAIAALTAFALLWRNGSRAVYRAAVQCALIAAVAVHAGVFRVMGS